MGKPPASNSILCDELFTEIERIRDRQLKERLLRDLKEQLMRARLEEELEEVARGERTIDRCPECKQLAVDSIDKLKDHMTAEHGGYYLSQIRRLIQ